jgi:hypothetical protein
VLDSEPPPTTVKVNGFTSVLSQPLRTEDKWNDEQKKVVEWAVHVGNLGHGMYDFDIYSCILFRHFHSAQKAVQGRSPGKMVPKASGKGRPPKRNRGHKTWTYTPEKDHNYSFAPETLLERATCSPETDVWMLGCLVRRILIPLRCKHCVILE